MHQILLFKSFFVFITLNIFGIKISLTNDISVFNINDIFIIKIYQLKYVDIL
jgi:hypothetical protein